LFLLSLHRQKTWWWRMKDEGWFSENPRAYRAHTVRVTIYNFYLSSFIFHPITNTPRFLKNTPWLLRNTPWVFFKTRSVFFNSCTPPKRKNSKRYSPYSPTNRETPVCRGFAPCSPSRHTHPDTHPHAHHRPHHHAISLHVLTILPDRQIPTSVTSQVSNRVSMWVSI
jgi:hypothetical protein